MTKPTNSSGERIAGVAMAFASMLFASSLPVLASPSFDDRGLKPMAGVQVALVAGDQMRLPQSKPAAGIQQPMPQYYGYYGPVGGTSVRPKPVLLGVGGWW
jgi:hypothetical protein